jgi:hypothetical protein
MRIPGSDSFLRFSDPASNPRLGDQIDRVQISTALMEKKEIILGDLRRANEALLTDTLLAA